MVVIGRSTETELMREAGLVLPFAACDVSLVVAALESVLILVWNPPTSLMIGA